MVKVEDRIDWSGCITQHKVIGTAPLIPMMTMSQGTLNGDGDGMSTAT